MREKRKLLSLRFFLQSILALVLLLPLLEITSAQEMAPPPCDCGFSDITCPNGPPYKLSPQVMYFTATVGQSSTQFLTVTLSSDMMLPPFGPDNYQIKMIQIDPSTNSPFSVLEGAGCRVVGEFFYPSISFCIKFQPTTPGCVRAKIRVSEFVVGWCGFDTPQEIDIIGTGLVENSLGQVDGAISAVYAPQRQHSEVFFRDANGLLHYSYVEGGQWRHDASNFGQVTGEISAVYSPQRAHSEVFFRDANGLLHYSYVEGGQWRHDASNFGVVDGDISAVYAPQRQHSEVFFRAPDGYLNYYYVAGSPLRWQKNDQAFRAFKVDGAIRAVYISQQQRSGVFFRGEDGLLHYFYEGTTPLKWHHYSDPLWQVDGDIAVVDAQRQHPDVFFRDANGRLHYSYFEGGQWKHDVCSFGSVSGNTGMIGSVFSSSPSKVEIFFKGPGGRLYYSYTQ